MNKPKSKRLRKKLFIDEFAILGFELTFKFTSINKESFNLMLDQLLEFVVSRELCMGGGGDECSFSAFICSEHRYGSAQKEDQQAIDIWLQKHKGISEITIGKLVDANYET